MEGSSPKDVCVHCGAPVHGDLDFCVQCGFDPRAGPGASHAAPRPAASAPPARMAAPPVVVPKGRVSMGLILGAIGLILAVVAIASIGWFVIESTDDASGVYCGLRGIEYRYANGQQVTYDYSRSYAMLEEEMNRDLDMRGVAGASFWLLVIGLSLAGMFLLFALLSLVGVFRGATAWLPMLTGLIAGIMIVLAASYFGIAFQDAMENDFEQELAESEDTDHGLGGVWYLALFGGILVLMGSLLTYVRPPAPVQMQPAG